MADDGEAAGTDRGAIAGAARIAPGAPPSLSLSVMDRRGRYSRREISQYMEKAIEPGPP